MSSPLKLKLCEGKDASLLISDPNNLYYSSILFISLNLILTTTLIVPVLQMRRPGHRKARQIDYITLVKYHGGKMGFIPRVFNSQEPLIILLYISSTSD